MARGWESKAVDEQQSAAEAARAERGRQQLTPAELESRAKRETLMLNRARTLQTLQAVCDRRHRALLEQTLAALDAELAALDAAADSTRPAPPGRNA
jgi:hypothetical protein